MVDTGSFEAALLTFGALFVLEVSFGMFFGSTDWSADRVAVVCWGSADDRFSVGFAGADSGALVVFV